MTIHHHTHAISGIVSTITVYDISRRANAPMYSVVSFILAYLLRPFVWHELINKYPVDLEGMNLRNLMDSLDGV